MRSSGQSSGSLRWAYRSKISLAKDASNPRYSSTAALFSSIGKSSPIVFSPKLDVRTEAEDEEELEMLGIGLKSNAETWRLPRLEPGGGGTKMASSSRHWTSSKVSCSPDILR